MLTCVARPKQQQQHGNKSEDTDSVPHTGKHGIKSLTSQIKGIALKASGAYKCNPGQGQGQGQGHGHGHGHGHGSSGPGEVTPDKAKGAWPAYRRTASTNSSSSSSTPRWGKEMEARLKGLSVGKFAGEVCLSASASGRRPDPVVLLDESDPKEWVAHVEPGVLITFLSLPRGANHLKRIRFNRDMFNQWQAQKWWTDNYEKVMELYNVQRLSRHAFPLPTPPRSDDELSKMESIGDSPVTPPLSKESAPRNLYRGGMVMGMGMGYSSSDSFEQNSKQSNSQQYNASTPKHSNITAKTEASSMDESLMSTPSQDQDADRSGELSISNASDIETEWVEEDEPGVYITIRALPGGRRELRRVRFSREKFGEMHARVWWEENRARIHEQYL